MLRRNLTKSAVSSLLLMGVVGPLCARQPEQGGRQGPEVKGERIALNVPPLFFKETWQRPPGSQGQVPAGAENLSNPNLELKVYGPDAKDLQISGSPESDTVPVNLWTGLCMAPVVATLRDKNNYVDLTGLAKVRWITRASGFHVIRPVLKLADGTWLVGDHADSNTPIFLESEFSFTEMRWIKLDVNRAVTVGNYGPTGESTAWWVTNADLSKVDEVGFADLMPGSGHGRGGWVNLAGIEVYGKVVPREAKSRSAGSSGH